jgi:alpha/beta superfamily hydrolase
MPEGCYYDPITAASFYDLFSDPGKTGMFSYYSEDKMKCSSITKIPCSTLVIFCTDGEAVTIPVPECKKIFRKYFNKDQKLDIVTINGANHSYHFKEKELSSIISRWLIEQIGRKH